MPAPWIVILIVLVAIIAAVAVIAAKSSGVKERPGKLPDRPKPKPLDIPKRKATPNINVPVDISPAPVPPAQPNGAGFTPLGSAGDETGDPVLARLVDLARSEFWIIPASVLFRPGDKATFRARLVDSASKPVAGVPCVFVRDADDARLAPPVKSDANGYAETQYTVQQADMVGNAADDVPDSGSYRIVVYAGGRRLQKYQHLHDVA